MKFTKKQMITGIMAGLMSVSMTVAWGQQAQRDEAGATKPVFSDNGDVIGTTRGVGKSTFNVKNLPQDIYLIDGKVADVNGDTIDDNVYLIGHKSNKDAIFADNLKLLVQDGVSKRETVIDLQNLGGYTASLFIGDFTGDKVNDVLVNAPTGGSGGIVAHVIVNCNGEEPAIIFNQEDNKGAKFIGSFIDGFKAELVNEATGRSIIVDLSAKKDKYLSSNYYNEDGTVLQAVKPYSYPFSVLEPIDIGRDGVYELRGIQKIVGAYGADAIGNVYSLWKFEDGHWNVKQIEVSSFLLPWGDN